ncbi:MAG: carbamate kinase [Acidimicrobiaceae bacterium]|nr:carbamate kinase [Acidimicrobiaceae bacterium]
MTETAVLALGGNALTREHQRGTLEEQYANALAMALSVRSLIRKGWNVVIVHGNGPQVGNLAIQHEGSIDLVPALPLFTLGAMTQGQLGSLICLALNEVCTQEIAGAVSIITHVEVDSGDPRLSEPTKPIGPFFDRSEAETLSSKRGWTMAEDSGRGYRRVVPSPRPMAPIEADAISALIDLGYIVVAGGGGGIPVARSTDGAYRGVDAVIDKDFAAERIADAVAAQALVMVTGVAAVQLDFGTPQQQAVTELTATEARLHLADGQFPPGSMGPKVEAAIEFVESQGRISAITSPELVYGTLDEPVGVIEGPRGTRIVPDPVPALLT